jgi:hypothetical protein
MFRWAVSCEDLKIFTISGQINHQDYLTKSNLQNFPILEKFCDGSILQDYITWKCLLWKKSWIFEPSK